MAVLDFLGRLHPVLLHLPIGILILAFAMSWWAARTNNGAEYRQAIQLATGAGALTAILSAATGYLLATRGDYTPSDIQWHQWLGFATAAAAMAAWILREHPRFIFVLGSSVALLVVTGHLGGEITHGQGFLTEGFSNKNENTSPTVVLDSNMAFYQAVIAPVLKEKCLNCHNESKRKGGLSMLSEADMLKGGKNGPALDPSAPLKSLLWQRVQLPKTEKKHMPPAGKPELDPREMKLLRFWLQQGCSFDRPIKDYVLSEDIKALMPGAKVAVHPVFSKKIPLADPDDIQAVAAAGFTVNNLGKDNHLLAISCTGQQRLDKQALNALKPIAKQIAWLDVSNSNFNSELLRFLPEMPHLIKLNMAHTQTGDALASFISASPYLSTVNLVGAQVGDPVLDALNQLEYLQNLYVWQTRITEQKLKTLQSKRPKLIVNTGAVIDTAGSVLQMNSPKIKYARQFFYDTVQVLLDFPFKQAAVYYTTDGTDPDTNAQKYQPETFIVLNKTTQLKASTYKPGWKPSVVAEAFFVKKTNKLLSAKVKQTPAERFPGEGPNTLIDLVTGEKQGDKNWMGFEGQHVEAILDLGQTKSISKVIAHCFENNGAWIFNPKAIHVWTSANGVNFTKQTTQAITQNKELGSEKANLFSAPLPEAVTARYVKVKLESLLQNPSWHPNPGGKCWVFVDEILVE